MKKTFVFLLFGMLLYSYTVSASSPNIIYDTMEYANVSELKSSWKVVGNTHVMSEEHYIKLVMENDGTSVCDYGIIKEFDPMLSGAEAIQFDFMQADEKSNCRIMDLRGYSEEKNSKTRMVCFMDISEGNVIARGEGNGSMGAGTVLIDNYEADRWYNIKIKLNTVSNGINFYVDDEFKAQISPMQSYESLTAIKFATHNATDASQTKENGANICIDNVSMSCAKNESPDTKSMNISFDKTADIPTGEFRAQLDAANLSSIQTQKLLLYSAFYKNKAICASATATATLPFCYEDRMRTEFEMPELTDEDVWEVKNYLFLNIGDNKYKIADSVVSVDKDGTDHSIGTFSAETDDAQIQEASVEYSDDKITVKGVTDTSGSSVTAYVFEDAVPEEWSFDKITSISAAVSDGECKFEIPIELGTGFSSGEYAILLMCDNANSEYLLDFLYVSETERDAFAGELNRLIKEGDVSALAAYLQREDNRAVMRSMNIILENMIDTDINKIAAYMINNNKDGLLADNIGAEINEATIYELLRGSSEENYYSRIVEYGSYINVHIDTERFKDPVLQKSLVKSLMSFDYETNNSAESLVSYYNTAVAVIIFNNAEFSELEGIIEKYNDIFKINLSAYIQLSSSNRAKVMQELSKREVEYIETYSENETNISRLFDEIVKNVASTVTTYPSGSGSSGGGSGGGGAVISVPVKKQSNTIKMSIPTEEIVSGENDNVQKDRPFKDLSPGHWAYEDIYYLYDNDIISGIDSNTVAPDRSVLREEFVKMLVAAFFEIDQNAENKFEDVSKDDWFAQSINTAAAYSLIQGFNGKFGVGSEITRQDAAVIIARVAEVKNIHLPENGYRLNDLDEISDYAIDSVTKLASAGIINGDENNNFNPQNGITRAETAKLIRKLINK